MKLVTFRDSDFGTFCQSLNRRSRPSDAVKTLVSEVMDAVRERGNAALLEYTAAFDKVELTTDTLRVSDAELDAAEDAVDEATKAAVAASRENVSAFAEASLRRDWRQTNAQGAEVGEIFQPFQRVGIYVPGGTAPLVSTSLMTVTLAKAAEVPEIVVTTPAGRDGSVNPALLYALKVAGATEIYKLGGAQAIAALSLGTETITPTVKIFGPGNSYVVEAKRQAFGDVAVDLLPGPSEVLVLADETGNPDFIAADLLAQAEHGGDSLAVFLTPNEALLEAVKTSLNAQMKTLSRQGPIQKVLSEGLTLALVESMEQGVALTNDYAPEHLSLIAKNEESFIPQIRTSGAIFLGNLSPVACGDFLAGPSHELPTGGAGKSFSGLTVDMFQRRTSIVKFDQAAIAKSAPIVETFARIEGLDAHGKSATIRVSS